MSLRAGSEVKALASSLKARVDLSLVAKGDGRSNRAHSKSGTPVTSSGRAHSKSGTHGNVVPNLSGAARAEALRLARLLASSHSN